MTNHSSQHYTRHPEFIEGYLEALPSQPNTSHPEPAEGNKSIGSSIIVDRATPKSRDGTRASWIDFGLTFLFRFCVKTKMKGLPGLRANRTSNNKR